MCSKTIRYLNSVHKTQTPKQNERHTAALPAGTEGKHEGHRKQKYALYPDACKGGNCVEESQVTAALYSLS